MKNILFTLLFLWCALSMAQPNNSETKLSIPQNSIALSSDLSNANFPRVFPDNKVIFKISAPLVMSMQVVIDRNYDMVKDENGVWSVITEPLNPGFHYYSYLIDGVSVSDPSTHAFYGYSRYSSGIEIPEKGIDFYTIKNVPHGEIRSVIYYSENLSSWRPLNIYVPHGYDDNISKKYPVLYLQHGGGENEQSWTVQGKLQAILDNLIAEGNSKEMLVVMTNGSLPNFAYNQKGMEGLKVEMIDNIIPFVEKNYRVFSDANHRALAGLSMGGGQSFFIGLGNPDVFSNVGVFSTGVFGGIPTQTSFDAEKEIPGIYTNTQSLNNKLKLFYISCGEQDQRINATRKIIEEFRRKGLKPVFSSFPGAHEWQVWRKSLHDLIPLLFN